jgi:hypothetical protein
MREENYDVKNPRHQKNSLDNGIEFTLDTNNSPWAENNTFPDVRKETLP